MGSYTCSDGEIVKLALKDFSSPENVLARKKDPDFAENNHSSSYINVREIVINRPPPQYQNYNYERVPINFSDKIMVQYFNKHIWHQFEKNSISISKEDAFGEFCVNFCALKVNNWDKSAWANRTSLIINKGLLA